MGRIMEIDSSVMHGRFASGAQLFRAPFLLPLLLCAGGASAAGYSCPKTPGISPEMGIVSRYYGPSVDATFSTMNPKAVDQQKPVRARVAAPVVLLNRLADDYSKADDADRRQVGECIFGLVHEMAQNAYLTEPKSKEDRYYRDWLMVATLTTLLSIDDDHLDKALDSPTRKWISSAAAETEAFFRSQPADNHFYWNGLSLILSGAVLKDTAIEDAGKRVLARGTSQINELGMLPAEVARGKRATHYHLFAAIPLAAMDHVTGGSNQAALSRLTRVILLDLSEGKDGPIAKKVGPQDPSESLPGLRLLGRYLPEDRALKNFYLTTTAEQPDSFFFLGGSVKRFESALDRSRARLQGTRAQ